MDNACLRRLRGALLAALAGALAAGSAVPAERPIVNEAQASYRAPGSDTRVVLRSNTVTAGNQAMAPATIAFYTGADFSRQARAMSAGAPVFIQVKAAACNRDTAAVEDIQIALRSTRTGNAHVYLAHETGANSGVFQSDGEIITRSISSASGNADDQRVAAGDSLQATTLSDCGGAAGSGSSGSGDMQGSILIDPAGVVFDSITNAEVAGASVTLVDVSGNGNGGRPGSPAVVFGYDGVTPAPSRVVTTADGRYAFPMVAPSQYRLDVAAPTGFTFASKLGVAQLPAGRTVASPGSYGGDFPVNVLTGMVILDVPLDPLPRALMVQKTASRSVAEVAESVEFSVSIKNAGELDLPAVSLDDTLSAGFSYVPGSARIDGRPAADPAGGRGPALRFAAGPLAVQATRRITYRAVAGTAALQGDGVSRAQAHGTLPGPTHSNVASITVTVQAGVFTDQATLLGTVYADCNRNGLKDTDEPGAPGVRLFMEDGSFVVTDGQGRYNFYGISPRTHVLKVDGTSLPAQATLSPAHGNRQAGDGRSRFVDPRKGEMHRADFALDGCPAPVLEALRARQERLPADREIALSLKTELRLSAPAVGDVRALPASGLVGDAGAVASTPTAAPLRQAAKASAPSEQPVAEGHDGLSMSRSLSAPNAALAFVGLHDGQVLPRQPLTLRVKGRVDTAVQLSLNGKPVPEDRIGERSRTEGSPVELRDYVGLALKDGDNTLTLTERDPFGNLRATVSVQVQVPGEAARLRLQVPKGPHPADGGTGVPVVLTLEDAQGLPVSGRTAVTLSSSLGRWEVDDLDPVEPGVQTFVESGGATLALRPPADAGEAELRAQAGPLVAQAVAKFVPPLRPMVAVGLVEGAINFRKFDPKAMLPSRAEDGFEQELRQFAGGAGDRNTAGARAAVFLKGKVRGDYLLTLGYDSDKAPDQRLFRDIQPDEFYPVYGDSSVKGFDAQSTGRLYVRVDRDRSFLLYGDFSTPAATPERQLGAYQRSLNGLRQHVEAGPLAVDVFASRDSSRQVVTELRGNGTSGPYDLVNGNARANSERVELLVRDRNQEAVVLQSTPQLRFSDYEFEPLTGRLLFRAPVPSLDANLNPVSIRVTYEVEQGGPQFWVAGADAQLKVNDKLTVGAAVAHDTNPLQRFEVASVNATVALQPKTRLTAEVAQAKRGNGTEADGKSSGGAQRVELQHDGDTLKARVHAARSDTGFANPSSSLGSGRQEAGAKASLGIDERTRLVGEALHTADLAHGGHREGVLLGVERSLGAGVKAEVGVRAVDDVPAAGGPEESRTRSVRAKLGSTVPGLPQASVYGEAEQDVRDHDKQLLAVGGEYQIANHGRVYLRHELISSLGGPYTLDPQQRRNTTVLGVDTDYMQGGRVFSEYRGRDGFNGRETEAAMGLRNQWSIAPGLRLNTSFERVQAISGATASPAATASPDSTAVTGAIEYTADPLWKGTARLELRDADSAGRSLLSTLGLARKLDADWTLLGKNIFSTATSGIAGVPDRLQERFQVGMAYRDTATNRANGLGRYEFKRESGVGGDEAARTVHQVSAHVDHQVNRSLVLTGQHAAKWVDETVQGLQMHRSAHLLTGRATQELGARWDMSLAMRLLADGHPGGSRQFGLGAEAGYGLQDNLWISAGYNVTGFKDRDLAPDSSTQRGFYLRLRFKFDETLLAEAAP